MPYLINHAISGNKRVYGLAGDEIEVTRVNGEMCLVRAVGTDIIYPTRSENISETKPTGIAPPTQATPEKENNSKNPAVKKAAAVDVKQQAMF